MELKLKMMIKPVLFIVFLTIICSNTSLMADDWPQWRGPDRNGVSKEEGLLKSWPQN